MNISNSLASTYPFVCPFCVKEAVGTLSNLKTDMSALKTRLSQVEEAFRNTPALVNSLGERLDALSEKVKVIPLLPFPNKMMSDHPPPPTTTSRLTPNAASSHTTSRYSSNSERRFNVVLFGLKESSKGTARQSRMMNDLEAASSTLNFLVSSINKTSISDCFRLGKYNQSRNRPLLVRLTRACDAMLALSQGYKLSKQPGTFIKPDLSPAPIK